MSLSTLISTHIDTQVRRKKPAGSETTNSLLFRMLRSRSCMHAALTTTRYTQCFRCGHPGRRITRKTCINQHSYTDISNFLIKILETGHLFHPYSLQSNWQNTQDCNKAVVADTLRLAQNTVKSQAETPQGNPEAEQL